MRQDRGAGERVGSCCTACQLVEHDAYYSEDAQKVRREIMGALMRELPHTATTERLLDVLEPGDHEVLLCLCGRVPLNAFPFYAAWHASKRLIRRVPFCCLWAGCGDSARILLPARGGASVHRLRLDAEWSFEYRQRRGRFEHASTTRRGWTALPRSVCRHGDLSLEPRRPALLGAASIAPLHTSVLH